MPSSVLDSRALCHPDDASNASRGIGFWPPDSFAHAKPVPVSEIAQRSKHRKLCPYPRVVYLCRLKSRENGTKSGK